MNVSTISSVYRNSDGEKLYKLIHENFGQKMWLFARCCECRVLIGHMMSDHVHMLVEIPPMFSVAQVMGGLK